MHYVMDVDLQKYEIASDEEDQLPFRCFICRESFVNPVVTRLVANCPYLFTANENIFSYVSNKYYWLRDGVCRSETHHHAKLCQNRSLHCGDIVISRFFKMDDCNTSI